MHKKIAVIGVGTAGLTSLSHCLGWLAEDWKVYSISDPTISILGIGESTGVPIPTNLYVGTKFTLIKDGNELDATSKFGVKYVGWRENDFMLPFRPPAYGIHFDNFKLKEFCFSRFNSIWGDKFVPVYGKVLELENRSSSAAIIMEDQTLEFDFIVDCRGYPTDYSEYNVPSTIPVNHCLVHGINSPGDWNWTYHVAHRNGWMFGIPLQSRQGWGYLYNDTITDRADAVDDIAERFQTRPDDLNLREFAFKNYYAKKFLDGRILKNGNRALFFEPIEAFSGYFYDQVMRYLIDIIYNQSSEELLNQGLTRISEDIVRFVSYVYHGGSTYDSEFWKITKSKCSEHLVNDLEFQRQIAQMKSMPLSKRSENGMFGIASHSHWIDVDKLFGYNYITDRKESKNY
jgi:hypothetical protein